jgi:trimeric autotransporter adhesin
VGTTALTVSAATLSSIAVTPASALLAPSTTLGFTATGTFSDGTKQNVNNLVTWSTSDASVVTINTNGSATGQKAGSAVITATAPGAFTSTANVIVEATPLQAINVTPASATVPETISTNFAATGVFGDGSNQTLTSFVTWASTPPAVATISSTGRATGLSPGTASITATFGGVTGPPAAALPNLTVTGATLVSIAVTPSTATVNRVAPGNTQQFTATGTFSDSSTVNLTSQVTWSSSDVANAVINAAGLATGTAAGTTNITATLNGVTSSPPSVLTVH